jgi:phosphoribosylanthranilate isomerase
VSKANVRIKFCGITSYEDAKAALDLGVDALGFNFYSKSARRVEPGAAQAIVRRLPKSAWMVGVFVDNEAAEIESIARLLPLDTLQFHGDHFQSRPGPPASLLGGWRSVLAVRAANSDSAEERFKILSDRIATPPDGIDHLLLDYRSDGPNAAYGGTGKQIAPEILARLAQNGLLANTFVSGGLDAENVGAVVEALQPLGVDVASGIESSPGRKDREKMRLFVEAVRSASSS